MDLRLELIPLPSADVDASKAFYVDRVGFRLDHDVEPGNGMRIVQLTPPGSSCSVVLGVGIGDPGAGPVRGLHLVVDDVEAARAELTGRGVEVSGVDDMGGVKYAHFSDPDGNSWALQEIPGGPGGSSTTSTSRGPRSGRSTSPGPSSGRSTSSTCGCVGSRSATSSSPARSST